jgi:hypothetical protein
LPGTPQGYGSRSESDDGDDDGGKAMMVMNQ